MVCGEKVNEKGEFTVEVNVAEGDYGFVRRTSFVEVGSCLLEHIMVSMCAIDVGGGDFEDFPESFELKGV